MSHEASAAAEETVSMALKATETGAEVLLEVGKVIVPGALAIAGAGAKLGLEQLIALLEKQGLVDEARWFRKHPDAEGFSIPADKAVAAAEHVAPYGLNLKWVEDSSRTDNMVDVFVPPEEASRLERMLISIGALSPEKDNNAVTTNNNQLEEAPPIQPEKTMQIADQNRDVLASIFKKTEFAEHADSLLSENPTQATAEGGNLSEPTLDSTGSDKAPPSVLTSEKDTKEVKRPNVFADEPGAPERKPVKQELADIKANRAEKEKKAQEKTYPAKQQGGKNRGKKKKPKKHGKGK